MDSNNWILKVYNNDTTKYEQVIDTFCKVLDISPDRAGLYAWDIHHRGEAVVAIAPKETVLEMEKEFATIGLETSKIKDE